MKRLKFGSTTGNPYSVNYLIAHERCVLSLGGEKVLKLTHLNTGIVKE